METIKNSNISKSAKTKKCSVLEICRYLGGKL
jgi:hypothetical protein